ncbi:AAA family ATPase [Acidisphaera sp. S103]|uniref:AAA family ATPase n=1 Tax=Acidisphaera sp. S103 TaxID=1747223 RepID=UPI00131BAAEE|nr:AAA family ATPase [Acidisphaera sp. S103]
MTIEELGPRICIMGPSNSGKSTLAAAIGRLRDLPAVHLDQLHHLPNTDWQPRPEAEFIALHDKTILAPRWVMDGNYSRCLPQRLERATGFILLDVPAVTSLLRYLRRSWFAGDRRGALEGNRDSVKWEMIHHIAITTRANRKRYSEMFDRITLPKMKLATARELNQFYDSAGLDR